MQKWVPVSKQISDFGVSILVTTVLGKQIQDMEFAQCRLSSFCKAVHDVCCCCC